MPVDGETLIAPHWYYTMVEVVVVAGEVCVCSVLFCSVLPISHIIVRQISCEDPHCTTENYSSMVT